MYYIAKAKNIFVNSLTNPSKKNGFQKMTVLTRDISQAMAFQSRASAMYFIQRNNLEFYKVKYSGDNIS